MEAIILLLWIGGAIVTGVVASAKGRSALGWAALAFFFSPLIGLIAVAAMPPVEPLKRTTRGV